MQTKSGGISKCPAYRSTQRRLTSKKLNKINPNVPTLLADTNPKDIPKTAPIKGREKSA